MFKWLSKPYPFPHSGIKTFYFNAGVSVFAALFLIFFKPFGLSEARLEHKNLLLAGYGVACFIATSIAGGALLLLRKKDGIEERWNVGLEILWVLFVITVIAFLNLLYSIYLGFARFNLPSFAVYGMYTLGIGFFPVVLSVVLTWQKLHNKNDRESREINEVISGKPEVIEPETDVTIPEDQKRQSVLLKADGGGESLQVEAEQLLFIESMDNYSAVHFLKNDKAEKTLLRGSLKHMETFLDAHPQIIRCHRTFIVNLVNVESASGNAQGYKLKLKNCERVIPVSRSFLSTVLEQFRSLSAPS